ncbi:DUF1428 family protein [Pseudokineococcus sp. 1T1Z-3]|uniref:DUF1428 family protein n=1 Tax=Pseudokineococcus sp. 1T1Z-3 TaxID=3132745 RepID=UPI00309676E8
MTFADITVVPVAESRKEDYLAFSRRMAEVYRDHGATRVIDYWQAGTAADPKDFHADETSYDPGALQAIADIAGTAPSESVVVTVMEWPSRESRDRGTAAATRDPRVTATLDEAPVFDGRRVVGDSFEVAMDVHDEN